MYCPNCQFQVSNNIDFCPNCGTNLKIVRENSFNNTSSNNKKNSSKHLLKVLIIIIVIIALAGLISLGVSRLLAKRKNKTFPDNKGQITEEKSLNTFQKLTQDYENNYIDINKYFTELFYYEYDYDKLDDKYQSDYEYYSSGCQSELLQILEENQDSLDKNIVKQFIEKITLSDISLNDQLSIDTQSRKDQNYRVKKLKDEENDQENAANHNLRKVYLSKKENFLIWYTDIGNDAITEKQLLQIADGLENTLSEMERIFKVDYSYTPYRDASFNDDYKGAKEVLQKNGISLDKINTAMSVYIYDTGSENTLAFYLNPNHTNLIVDLFTQFGLVDNDGIVSFPYITINKSNIDEKEETLEQVYIHELFHHFQYLYCMSTTNERCVNESYAEGMANMASALISNSTKKDNFLNVWAGIYTSNTSSSIEEITDGASYGYGTFPYLYVYSQVVNNWVDILMPAHNEAKPYEYLKHNTSIEDLIKISDILSYSTLVKDFSNNALYSSKNIKNKEYISTPKKIESKIGKGAIDYYIADKNINLEVISENGDYIGVKLLGYKDNKYTLIMSSMGSLNVDLSYYANYEKFYLAISNANVNSSYNYIINVQSSEYAQNSEFITTFKNYNMEIQTDITISGINTKTVSKGIMDELHQKAYLDITTTSMGIVSLNNKMYHDYNSGYSYLTEPYGGDVWWKEKQTSKLVDLGKILDKLINKKNVTKVSESHYKVKMTKDEVKELVKAGNADSSIIKGNVEINVYLENGYITKLEYDFTKMVKGFDLFTTTIIISNYDNAQDVEIPQSIIDNAKEK